MNLLNDIKTLFKKPTEEQINKEQIKEEIPNVGREFLKYKTISLITKDRVNGFNIRKES